MRDRAINELVRSWISEGSNSDFDNVFIDLSLKPVAKIYIYVKFIILY